MIRLLDMVNIHTQMGQNIKANGKKIYNMVKGIK